MNLGLKESAPDYLTIGPFLSISFVTGVQPLQLYTADVLSEQLFICLFKHPSGDLWEEKEKKAKSCVPGRGLGAQAVAKGSCCCPSQLTCICSLSARKKKRNWLLELLCKELQRAFCRLGPAICIPNGGSLHRNLRNSGWSCFLVSGAILCNVYVVLLWVRSELPPEGLGTWKPLFFFFFYFFNPDYVVFRGKCKQHLEDVECYFAGLCAYAQDPPSWIQPWQLELRPCKVWAEQLHAAGTAVDAAECFQSQTKSHWVEFKKINSLKWSGVSWTSSRFG